MLKKLCITIMFLLSIPHALAQYTTLELLQDAKKQNNAASLEIGGETLYETDPKLKAAIDRALQPVGLDLNDFDMSTIVTPDNFDRNSYSTNFWQKRLRSMPPYENNELELFLSYAPNTQQIVIVVYNIEGAEIADQVFYVLGDKKAAHLITNIVEHEFFAQSLTHRVMQHSQ